MVKRLILVLSTLLFFASCSYLQTSLQQPNLSLKDDQYWAQLVKTSEESNLSILDIVKNKNPALYAQIINDAKDTQLLDLWGQSLNFDSGAKKQIINDKIISALHSQFGIKLDIFNSDKVVHAGITHTYGYLFSVLDTPYGYKRKRWVLPTFNFGFSLKGLSLSPETTEGGLLSNVTYFMGMLSFKNESEKKALKNLKNVSTEIRNFDYSSLKRIEYLEESFSNFTLRTTLIPLVKKHENEENDYLLIYSILDRKLAKESLVTAFPININAYRKIISSEFLGSDMPIVIRYNAYLEGQMGKNLKGLRKLRVKSN